MNNQNKNFTGLNKPAAAEPAKRLLVVAEANGWSVHVKDYDNPTPICGSGVVGPTYVYTDAGELAAAVRGLVENGTPLKTAKQLGILSGIHHAHDWPLYFCTALDYENASKIGSLQDDVLRLEGACERAEKNAEGFQKENARITAFINQNALNYEKGRTDGRNEFLGRNPWHEIDELQKENDRLSEGLAKLLRDAQLLGHG